MYGFVGVKQSDIFSKKYVVSFYKTKYYICLSLKSILQTMSLFGNAAFCSKWNAYLKTKSSDVFHVHCKTRTYVLNNALQRIKLHWTSCSFHPFCEMNKLCKLWWTVTKSSAVTMLTNLTMKYSMSHICQRAKKCLIFPPGIVTQICNGWIKFLFGWMPWSMTSACLSLD